MKAKKKSTLKTRKNKKYQVGGKAATMSRFLNFENSSIVGAGGFGMVLTSPIKNKVFKLLYDINECENLKKEANIQEKIYKLFKKNLPEVKIPEIYHIFTKPIKYKNIQYLCGIEMELLKPPEGFSEQLHMLLGYHNDDIDEEWGKTMSEPVSSTNPTRGFFASPETLELVWEEEKSLMTINNLAFLMGKSLRLLLDNGILPIDLEWVWSNGYPYIIDFGLCEIRHIDPFVFLKREGVSGLAHDLYIPKENDRGYSEFMKGFSTTI
jgi:hypothetical protein